MRVVCVIALIVLVSVSASVAQRTWDAIELSITTSDSLRLYAWLGAPNDVKEDSTARRLIVLLPMMSQTHESFSTFLDAVSGFLNSDSTAAGAPIPYTLALDMRGHGKSTAWRRDSSLSFQTMTPEDFAHMPDDVVEMLTAVLKNDRYRIDTADIAVIGASIGANAAIMATEELPFVSSVVMLSPGHEYRGLRPAKALGEFDGECLIVATTADTYSASSSRKLAAVNNQCELWLYEGQDHGTNIINNDPEAMQELLGWLYGE